MIFVGYVNTVVSIPYLVIARFLVAYVRDFSDNSVENNIANRINDSAHKKVVPPDNTAYKGGNGKNKVNCGNDPSRSVVFLEGFKIIFFRKDLFLGIFVKITHFSSPRLLKKPP